MPHPAMSTVYAAPPHEKKQRFRHAAPPSQHGIVLVLALVLLVVISLLALTTLRQAGSAESVAGNTRTTELATQSAEIALRHCEASLLAQMTVIAGGVSVYPTTFVATQMLPPSAPPQWQNKALWDSASPSVLVLPLALLNQPGMAVTTYSRPSECMVQQVAVATGTSADTFYVITARGFGPEVAAVIGAARVRPAGSEVWLQSNIRVGST